MCKHDWTRLTAGALLALTLTACSAAPTAEPAPLPADTTVESVQPETAAPAETTGAAEAPAEDLTAVGSLLLSLNPEVRMHYSADGLVVSLEGRNDDGRAVAAALGDQAGRPCDEVADDLVEHLYGGGYLSGGQSIVVKLEAGSEEPGTQVLEAVADGIHAASVRCGAEAQALTVSGQELDDSGRLTVAAAEALALEQLGMTEAQFTPRTYDDDVYELEFTSGVRDRRQHRQAPGRRLRRQRRLGLLRRPGGRLRRPVRRRLG